jgi:hypothetical protein
VAANSAIPAGCYVPAVHSNRPLGPNPSGTLSGFSLVTGPTYRKKRLRKCSPCGHGELRAESGGRFGRNYLAGLDGKGQRAEAG